MLSFLTFSRSHLLTIKKPGLPVRAKKRIKMKGKCILHAYILH
nr:MAG TPA: hypothetical protein [Caudoviricetes sp.]